jgi:DNA polymerase (family 10)
MSSVEGIGPKTVKVLYEKLANIEDLEKATKEQRIRNVPGFGEKSEQQILKGIEFFKKTYGDRRFILSFIFNMVEDIIHRLRKLDVVEKAELASSTRRMKETV